ncbi:hypothetical protein EsH8_I_001380 [Colletotrichum jinshuiense]
MCSIGALYRLDRRRARTLYDLALRLVKPVLTSDCPLWVIQTRFLLTFYATFSGDINMASWPVEESGFYTLIYGKAQNQLNDDNFDLLNTTWTDWVQRESLKRLLGGIYVANTVNAIIYGVNPVFNTTKDLELEHFHDENLWNATSENEWRELRRSYKKRNHRTAKDILEDLLSENMDHAKAAYLRLIDSTTSFDRLTLLAEDPNVINASVTSFAPWDAGLAVTKWVHSVELDVVKGIEPSRAEGELLAKIKAILEEADYDPEESKSFAAGLARIWSLFLQDVWVWGITRRMGDVLERLATAYESANEIVRQS